MVYAKSITTPKNTASASPLETTLKITKGLIYFLEVFFPPGSSGLLHIKIMDGNYQLLPSTTNETLFGDNSQVKYDDLYIKDSEPFSLKIVTYNLDDTYDHMLQVRVGLVSKEVFQARFLPTMAYDYFNQLLSAASKQQEEEKIKKRQELLASLKAGV